MIVYLYDSETGEFLDTYSPQKNPKQKGDEYKQMIETRLREEKRQELIAQIDELDKKRIRAICEPEQKTENVSWLEFYTAQIVELRKQLQEV